MKQIRYDSQLLEQMGGIGKSAKVFGKAMGDIGLGELKRRNERKRLAIEEGGLQLRRDTLGQGRETLDFQKQKHKDYLPIQQKNAESLGKRLEWEGQDRLEKESTAAAERGANISTMRKLLKSSGIDDTQYSDDEIFYGAENIERIHTDQSPLQFKKIEKLPDGTVVSIYIDGEGNPVARPLEFQGMKAPMSDNQKIMAQQIKDSEVKAPFSDDFFKPKKRSDKK